MAKTRSLKNSFVVLNPPLFSHLLSISPLYSLLYSPKNHHPRSSTRHHLSFFFFFFFFFSLLTFSGICIVILSIFQISHKNPSASYSVVLSPALSPSPSLSPQALAASLSVLFSDKHADNVLGLSSSAMVPLPPHVVVGGNLTEEEREFWKQPNGEGYRPCLDFSIEYRRASAKISKEKNRFLVVVVNGGLNQQRNQVVDAVVLARILEAALVVPVLQVNPIWGDESEFSDVFDVEHFKKTLKADVRIVSSLPSTHLLSRQSIETQIPFHAPPLWIRAKFLKKLNEEGLLVFKSFESKLSKNLPSDLQMLRCKVAFHALRFSAPIRELGNRIARRMWIEGPYIAIHLRLEKDVWIRTGCLTGLGPEYDKIMGRFHESNPQLDTGRLNMSYVQRRAAGLCPLNALEMARFLKALGAPKSARIYIAGGKPFGGSKALKPLSAEFPHLVSKEMLAHDGELTPYLNKSSTLAAIDYIVSLSSDVFVPSHGGNMGRAMQGHRAYVGHRKYITPNKRMMIPMLEEDSISDEELSSSIKRLHKSQGQPEPRTNKIDRDVIAYPVPECMCKA